MSSTGERVAEETQESELLKELNGNVSLYVVGSLSLLACSVLADN